MKLVGADSGRYEHEQLVERVVLAPSERAVIDVLFDQPGQVTLEHHTPQQTYSLAADHRHRRTGHAFARKTSSNPARERGDGGRARPE